MTFKIDGDWSGPEPPIIDDLHVADGSCALMASSGNHRKAASSSALWFALLSLPTWAGASTCEESIEQARQRVGNCLRETGESCTKEFAEVEALESARRETGDCGPDAPPAPAPEPTPTVEPASPEPTPTVEPATAPPLAVLPEPGAWVDANGIWFSLGPAFSSLGGVSGSVQLSVRKGPHLFSALFFHQNEDGGRRYPRLLQQEVGAMYGFLGASEVGAVAASVGLGVAKGTRRGDFVRSVFHPESGDCGLGSGGPFQDDDCEEAYTELFYEPVRFVEPVALCSLELLFPGRRGPFFWGLSVHGAVTRVDATAAVSLVIRAPRPRKVKTSGVGAAPQGTRILVDRTDGRTYIGTLVSETADTLVIETDSGARIEIPVAEISKRTPF